MIIGCIQFLSGKKPNWASGNLFSWIQKSVSISQYIGEESVYLHCNVLVSNALLKKLGKKGGREDLPTQVPWASGLINLVQSNSKPH